MFRYVDRIANTPTHQLESHTMIKFFRNLRTAFNSLWPGEDEFMF